MGRIRVAWFILFEQQTHKGQMRKKAGNEAMVRSRRIFSPTHHSLYRIPEELKVYQESQIPPIQLTAPPLECSPGTWPAVRGTWDTLKPP